MGTGRFIHEIVNSSGIPSETRRREILRELQAHVEDFMLHARSAGHTDEEAERLALANFGDPRQIAMQFDCVYRKQRAALRISVFLFSTVTVAIAIAGMVMSLQAGLALGFGLPLARIFSAHHTMIEAADILASATAYLGLISLQKALGGGLGRAATALIAIFAVLMALFRIAGAPWMVIAFGLIIGLFLRTAQTFLKHPAARTFVVLSSFALFGVLAFGPASMASWLVMGAGYLAMTRLAARVDGALERQYL